MAGIGEGHQRDPRRRVGLHVEPVERQFLARRRAARQGAGLHDRRLGGGRRQRRGEDEVPGMGAVDAVHPTAHGHDRSAGMELQVGRERHPVAVADCRRDHGPNLAGGQSADRRPG
ncbi:MAG: hypothetical protein ACRD0G_12110 [Acidimicrobiales bacterium]